MKQKITLTQTQQFKIPTPYRAWCHPCNQGFMSIAELQTHDHEKHLTGVPGLRSQPQKKVQATKTAPREEAISSTIQADKTLDYGPPCTKCGSIMERAGTCYTCPGCGETSGCS